MAQYTAIFTKPYEDGYENLPSQNTPITAETLNDKDDAIVNIETYLSGNDIPSDADGLSYDNTGSGLTADNVQGAIDELNDEKVDKTGGDVKTDTTGQFSTITGGLMQSCDIKLEPIQDLHGYDKPWVGGSGKNLIPMTVANLKALNTTGTWSGNTYTFQNGAIIDVLTDDDGNVIGFKGSGTTTASTSYNFNLCDFDFVSGTTYKLNGITGGSNSTYRINISGVSNYTSGDNTVNGDGSTHTIRIQMQASYSPLDFTVTPMLRLATETDASFEPYTNICGITGHSSVEVDVTDADSNTTQYTVALGQTVYGGSVDVVSGVLTIDEVGEELSDLSWSTRNTGTNNKLLSASVSYLFDKTNFDFITEKYKYIEPVGGISQFGPPDDEQIGIYPITTSSSKTIYIVTSVSDTISGKVVYKLAIPQTIQLTPQQLETLIGQNTVTVPLDGQSLDSLTYREVFAWDDVERAVSVKLDLSSVAPIEYTDKASQSYNQKQLFIKDNKLCQALASISSGASFTENTNFKYTTLAEIIEPLIP